MTGTLNEPDTETLYRRHGRSILRYVQTMTFGDRHLAEDIVQETLLRAWQHPELMLDRPASLHAWLATVARNLVIDQLRRRQARPPEVDDTHLKAVPEATRDADRVLTALTLKAAVAMLTATQRQIVVELYYRDRTLIDVANELGIPVGTVKSRAHSAVRALRAALEEPSEALAGAALAA